MARLSVVGLGGTLPGGGKLGSRLEQVFLVFGPAAVYFYAAMDSLYLDGQRTGRGPYRQIADDRSAARFPDAFPAQRAVLVVLRIPEPLHRHWRYVNVEHFSPIEYALFASLAFSTVLPAVLSTNSLLFGATSLTRVFTGLPAICPNASRRLRPWAYGFAALSLFLVPVWPQYLYPLVWLAPLPAVVAIQRWCGQSSGFEGLSHGDWRQIVIPAFSALICGFFWELWNWNSLAHWT